MKKLWQFLLLMLLTFTFGGFLFYAAVVVPLGSQVLDKTTQGFVTLRVTQVLNIAVALCCVALLFDLGIKRKQRPKNAQRIALGCTTLIANSCMMLTALHPHMQTLLDPSEFAVLEPDKFYGAHRIYLGLSTLQWLSSLPILWILTLVDSTRPTESLKN